MNELYTKELYYGVYQAIVALARVDDYARTLDGHGFSKIDTEFGNSLASRPWERWSPKQIYYGWKLAMRYRRQLSRLDLLRSRKSLALLLFRSLLDCPEVVSQQASSHKNLHGIHSSQ